MRVASVSAGLLIAVLAAAPVHASFPRGSSEPQEPTEQPSATAPAARQQAERLYADAYDEVAKAKKDLADGKKKNAEKKFKKALGRGEQATELDSTYHEAWNLVGYSARQLGKYDLSLAAYERCLRLQPNYAPAREYLGEAYIDLGQPDKAREQLVWLERLSAVTEAATLKARLDEWLAAHPEAKAGAGSAGTEAAADSSGSGSGGSEH
jgi:tetratricopeptide (TPR) repeat protein